MKTKKLPPSSLVRPGPRSRYRKLPFIGPVLDDLLAWLRRRGYSEWTICNYLKSTRTLFRWLRKRQSRRLSDSDLRAAYDHFHNRCENVAAAARMLGRFLAEHRLLRVERPKPLSHSQKQLQLFERHLRQVRGLADMTITGHLSRVRIFLDFLKLDERLSAIRTLDLEQIGAFLRRSAQTNNRFSLQHIVASLRAFLRYQHAQGCLPQPLHLRIDTPRTYRLERLPRALPWDQVVALLRSIDQTTPGGLRDFTLLYLAACYGLRSGELVRLTLDDIDWRAGTLKVVQTKTKQALLLPLTDEAGQVLVHICKPAARRVRAGSSFFAAERQPERWRRRQYTTSWNIASPRVAWNCQPSDRTCCVTLWRSISYAVERIYRQSAQPWGIVMSRARRSICAWPSKTCVTWDCLYPRGPAQPGCTAMAGSESSCRLKNRPRCV